MKPAPDTAFVERTRLTHHEIRIEKLPCLDGGLALCNAFETCAGDGFTGDFTRADRMHYFSRRELVQWFHSGSL